MIERFRVLISLGHSPHLRTSLLQSVVRRGCELLRHALTRHCVSAPCHVNPSGGNPPTSGLCRRKTPLQNIQVEVKRTGRSTAPSIEGAMRGRGRRRRGEEGAGEEGMGGGRRMGSGDVCHVVVRGGTATDSDLWCQAVPLLEMHGSQRTKPLTSVIDVLDES